MPLAASAAIIPGTPTQPNNMQQEFTQLNQIIDEIKTTKKTLKDQIKQLDDKLNETRADVASMRKNSSEILSKAQEAEAQALLTTINTGLSKISTTQTFVSGDFSRTFEGNITKIQSLIEQGQGVIKTLQAKGYQYQILQAQIQSIEEKTKEIAAKEALAKEKLAAQPKKEGIWDTITDFFAKAALRIKKFFIGIKNIFAPESKDLKDVKKTPESVDVKKKVTEAAVSPSTPTPTVSSTTQNLITSQLKEADTTIKQLEDQQKSIDQKLASLEQSTTNFIESLKSIHPVAKSTAQLIKEEHSQEPTWKRLILFVTSEILDAVAFMVNGIKFVFKTIYNYFFSEIVNRFVGDVKEKIKEDEAKEKQSQTKRDKGIATTAGSTVNNPPQQTQSPPPVESSSGVMPSTTMSTPAQASAPSSMPSSMPTQLPSTPTPAGGMPSMPMA
jgi:Na+-transporting methylmalonyl-CoA/oxaloacetate decarboxylase gamma subunit